MICLLVCYCVLSGTGHSQDRVAYCSTYPDTEYIPSYIIRIFVKDLLIFSRGTTTISTQSPMNTTIEITTDTSTVINNNNITTIPINEHVCEKSLALYISIGIISFLLITALIIIVKLIRCFTPVNTHQIYRPYCEGEIEMEMSEI